MGKVTFHGCQRADLQTLAIKIPSKMCQVLMFETGTTDFFLFYI